jgi:hypothetical protein
VDFGGAKRWRSGRLIEVVRVKLRYCFCLQVDSFQTIRTIGRTSLLQWIAWDDMTRALFTWRLAPTGADTMLWSLSSYHGTVLVRAYDELQARSMIADRLRVPVSANGDGSRASPWYLRELVSCEKVEEGRLNAARVGHMEFARAKHVAQPGSPRPEKPAQRTTTQGSSGAQPDMRPLLPSDVRQAIAGLLVAQEVTIQGRWLDVSTAAAETGDISYVILPTSNSKSVIAKRLTEILGRPFTDRANSWQISRDEASSLVRALASQLQDMSGEQMRPGKKP